MVQKAARVAVRSVGTALIPGDFSYREIDWDAIGQWCLT